MSRILLILAALVPACVPARAQGLSVRPEQEVRIQAPGAGLRRLTIVTVMEVKADTLVVQTAVPVRLRSGRELRQHAVPLAQVRRLDVLAGTRNRAGGMAKGAVIGAGAGVLGALFHKSFSRREIVYEECPPEDLECFFEPDRSLSPYDHTQSAVIVGAGAVLGMVVGGIKPGRSWRSALPLPVEAAVGPAQGGGVRLEGTIRF
ncbi:MAG TPA: hypothetical protein VHG93_14535 [Longimicrobium sp.]|nr:hypothetical protein [Longimicrobium sp.]